MASIWINAAKQVNGKLTVVRTLNNEGKLIIEGQLSTHRYFEEIVQLETDRLIVYGVNVVQESFGSEDFNILYGFTADRLVIKGGESHLTDEEINEIEEDMYSSDDEEE